MHKMTEQNLNSAFAGESQAHMRYLIFADKATKEGKPNIAKLFTAIAFAEQVHATNHFRALKNLKDTPNNLEVAIAGETYEVEEMYPAYKAVAELQNEKEAVQSTKYALEAEKIHALLYKQAKELAGKGKDIEIKEVYICEVCGWTGVDKLPDKCPICGVDKSKIRKF
jgi:rubrerythrin